jgi:phenylpropionate dioxygenase-like ring-hydroxylating dioxygenase large terminal subunit
MYPFRENSFAVLNGWYVVAFAADVKAALLSRTVLNQPIVLYRKQDGQAVAVGGRCPHRHFPLGRSCLKNDEIVCGYHGITFGPDGRCTNIPAQSSVPAVYKIPTYPLVEHGMWLFIWPGDPDIADPALLPDLKQIGYDSDDLVSRPFYTHEIACRYQLLNDNLLDLSHLGFLHGTSIGTRENASVPEELTKRPGYLSSRRYIRNAPAPPVSSDLRGYGGPLDRTVGMDFYLPGFHAGIGDSFYPEGHEHAGQPFNRSRVFHAVTPATEHTCYYFFGMATPRGEGLDEAKEYLVKVIAEDVFASEEIEKMLELVGHPNELMIKTDQNAVEGRRMLQRMMDAEGSATHEKVRQRVLG